MLNVSCRTQNQFIQHPFLLWPIEDEKKPIPFTKAINASPDPLASSLSGAGKAIPENQVS
jgi:hypothetical protein